MRLYLMAAAGAALLVTGCDGSNNAEVRTTTTSGKAELVAVSSLDCPDREGDLRLASRDANGRSCFYRSENGAQVELRLASLEGGTAEALLDRMQQDLAPLVPGATTPPEPEAPEAPEPPTPVKGERSRVRIGDVVDIRSQGEEATIKLPGVSIQANDGRAKIKVDDEEGEAVNIDAHDGGAVIRADSTKGGDIKSTYLVASEHAGPSGVRLAGYAARGPAAGPLVVGVLRAKNDRDRDVFDDMEDLVERNTEKRRR